MMCWYRFRGHFDSKTPENCQRSPSEDDEQGKIMLSQPLDAGRLSFANMIGICISKTILAL